MPAQFVGRTLEPPAIARPRGIPDGEEHVVQGVGHGRTLTEQEDEEGQESGGTELHDKLETP